MKIKASEFTYCTMRMLTIFNSDTKSMLKMWGVEKNIDSTKSKDILGMKYRPIPKAIKDAGYSLYDQGLLKDRRKNPKVSSYKF